MYALISVFILFLLLIFLSPTICSSNLAFAVVSRIIDNKSLRLITEASESSPSKPDKENLDAGLRGILFYY